MKNVSSLKSNNTNSPKTPGGISKSLLTPCRRVGLSRNWRKNGPSPFISPLSGNAEVKIEKVETRKRKECVSEDVDIKKTKPSTVDDEEVDHSQNPVIDKTPSRNLDLPRRKKSKTLLSALNKSQEDTSSNKVVTNETNIIGDIDEICPESVITSKCEEAENNENVEVVSTPIRSKSKKKKKHSPLTKSAANESKVSSKQKSNINEIENDTENLKETTETTYTVKEKSPNDLKKECIVVIQRKILKNINKKQKSSSQTLFNSDSESDDVPLIQLNNKEPTNLKPKPTNTITDEETPKNNPETSLNENEDDDFIDEAPKTSVKSTKSPRNKLSTNRNPKTKAEKVTLNSKPSSYDDDDDDDFDNKKTILIRKTYEKVSKPLKAKSTGSITQKDIDDLKARIEAKKRLLLAQSISPDTETLRNLIKKWQKGCQDALMELLDLMKTKFHDKNNMDYSEMLKALKIPAELVGYDSENDCFVSPDDATIILGPYKNI